MQKINLGLIAVIIVFSFAFFIGSISYYCHANERVLYDVNNHCIGTVEIKGENEYLFFRETQSGSKINQYYTKAGSDGLAYFYHYYLNIELTNNKSIGYVVTYGDTAWVHNNNGKKISFFKL